MGKIRERWEQNGGGANGSSTGALSAAADAGFEYCSSYPLELLVFENERTGPFGLDATASALGTVASRVRRLRPMPGIRPVGTG